MDYFIDDMLRPSRRGSTRSHPTSPAHPEPPLPPAPTPTRLKKAKGDNFSAGTKRSVAETSKSSKAPDIFLASAVPLPDTPVPPKVPPNPGTSSAEATLLSPRITEVRSDYFPEAEPPSAYTVTGLRVRESSTPNLSAFLTQMSELPSIAQEEPHPEEHPAENECAKVEPSVAEQQELGAHYEDEESTIKELSGNKTDDPPPSLHVLQTPVPVIHDQPAIMIGISGSPGSGKTSLAYLLSHVLPPTTSYFIIHQDDFFIRKHLLIPDADGRLEVNYRRTVDFTSFKNLMACSRSEGRLPPGFRSLQLKEARDNALLQISAENLERLRVRLADVSGLQDGRPVGIVDGFFLFHSETIRNLLDVKLLLRASKDTARSRRLENSQYDNAASGHERHPWDTMDYFDRVIWPNYADEHAVLFENRDVEGRAVPEICEGVHISVQPDLDMGMEDVLQWVVEVFAKGCEAADCHEREVTPVIDWKEDFEICNCNEGFLGKIRQAIFNHI